MGSNSKPYPLPHPAWSEIATKDIVDAVQRALLEPDRVEAIFQDLDTRLNKKLKEL
jgi:hypothetical protein